MALVLPDKAKQNNGAYNKAITPTS